MNSLLMHPARTFPQPIPPPLEDPVARTMLILGSLLRGEIAATEAYRLALRAISREPVKQVLSDCLCSHEIRAAVLGARIVALGGDSTSGSGLWGVFARTAEVVAAMLGRQAILRTLEEGERYGLASYHRDIPLLEDATRHLVKHRLLPEQEETLMQVRRLIGIPAQH